MDNERIDITRNNICQCGEIVLKNDSIHIFYNLFFDVTKFFGISLSEGEWIRLHSEYAKDGDLNIFADVVFGDDSYHIDYTPTKAEYCFFKLMSKRYLAAIA